MINDLLLPIGSYVKIKNNEKTIMIAGYLPYDNENKIYDYIGVFTPIGIRKTKEKRVLNKDYVFFRNDYIEKITFIGYSNNKSEFYRKYLINLKNKFEDIKQDLSLESIKKIMIDSLPSIKDLKREV